MFFSAALDHRFYAAFLIALTIGLRQGEILSLRWIDVDLDVARIFVLRTASHVWSRLVYSDPKSRSVIGVVALPPETVNALRYHKKMQDERRTIMMSAYQNHDLLSRG